MACELDSGSKFSIISIEDCNKYLDLSRFKENGNFALNLSGITGHKLQVVGEIKIKVKKHDKDLERDLVFVVVDSKKKFLPLIGREWLDQLWPNWRDHFVNKIESPPKQIKSNKMIGSLIEKIKTQYKSVFQKSLEEPIEKFLL